MTASEIDLQTIGKNCRHGAYWIELLPAAVFNIIGSFEEMYTIAVEIKRESQEQGVFFFPIENTLSTFQIPPDSCRFDGFCTGQSGSSEQQPISRTTSNSTDGNRNVRSIWAIDIGEPVHLPAPETVWKGWKPDQFYEPKRKVN